MIYEIFIKIFICINQILIVLEDPFTVTALPFGAAIVVPDGTINIVLENRVRDVRSEGPWLQA